MRKKPRPTVLEKIVAKQAPQAAINPNDITNVLTAARRGIGSMSSADMVNVSTSIANLEAALAQIAAATPAPAAAPVAPAPPAEPAKA